MYCYHKHQKLKFPGKENFVNNQSVVCFCLQLFTFYVDAKPTEGVSDTNHSSSSPQTRPKRDTECQTPADATLWEQYLKYITNQRNYHESMAMLSIFKDHIINQHLEKSSGNTDKLIEGRKEMCGAETFDAFAPLRERSTCPWYLVYNVDADR